MTRNYIPRQPINPYSKLAYHLRRIAMRMNRGCGNHGCRIAKPIGMATNGPCTCGARDFQNELRDICDKLGRMAQ